MKETLEGHFCGADDEHNIVYPKKKTLLELLKQENPALERPVKVDKNEKKHFSVSTYIDMIDDVSQKLKIGFEQYKKAKEEEIRKLKNELAAEKLFSDGVHKENQMLVQNLHKAKAENQQLTQNLDEVKAKNKQLTHDSEATQAENRQLAYKLYLAQESNKQLAQDLEQDQESNKQLAQNLEQAQKSKRQLARELDEAQKTNRQLAHDLDEAQAENKQLARGQGEAMDECIILEYKLEEAKAENEKLSRKLDDARFDIGRQNIAIGHLKKDAERKDTAMQADVSEVKEKFAREMIDSGIRFVKDMKTAIDDSQTFKCMGLLNHMTDDCFGKHEPIHRELKDMIQGIFGSREQVAKEQNEPRPNNIRVEKGGVYNAEVHHQDIHPKVDKRDSLPKADQRGSLPEVDQLDSLPRYKRKRLGLEGEDYEWR